MILPPFLDENKKLSRRSFIHDGCRALCALTLGGLAFCQESSLFSQTDTQYRRPARHWRTIGKTGVQCLLCPNGCELESGQRGICRVRENIGGTLFTLVYSRLAAVHTDPIEKKPFFHFMPGSFALSVATAGCNLRCRFCQNWQLSQSMPEDLSAARTLPAELVSSASENSVPIIAFTYNEPTVQFEYIMDTAQRARAMRKKSVIISNGYIRPAAGREFAQALDGIKIDLKSFTQRFYSDICGGNLNDVLANLELIHSAGRWLEIVVLIIPSMNDSPREIRNMARWISTHLSANVPVHFLRFHPMYLMTNLPPTPVGTLERCHEIARAEGLRYAYIGNVPGHRLENTFCHSCNRLIIQRSGIFTSSNLIKNGRCPFCHVQIPGVWA